ncbi:MAG: UDP-glucose/GDP-mannose dehydrogenase family protein [Planctomycetes bacterium]|nr:UDP-glucose/GDP-mannose dehydrogenase family protein [Planctomycetota bacterium]
MKITIIGSGHVGLVSGLCFAEKGHEVLCVDHDTSKVEKLSRFEPTFHEPGLEELLTKHKSTGLIRFSTSTKEGVAFGQAIFVCVSTPSMADGNVDMRYFEAVSRDIAESIDGYKVIVEKSTVPIKTSEKMRRTIERYAPSDVDFDVASNPEFLREGAAIQDTMEPDRIVIGTNSERAEKILREVYSGFDAPIVSTSIHSSEMIKLASNAFLATRLSFINAIGRICELGGADVDEVAKGMGLDPRIGPHFLKAGIGYGGSCFPKDVEGLYHVSAALGYDFELLREVQLINDDQWYSFVERIEKELWTLNGKTIALWGASFKPHTDDIREAPAVKIARELVARGASVRCSDPVAVANMQREVPEVAEVRDPIAACEGADALVLATEWQEFLEIDPSAVAKVIRVPLLFDGRNALDREGWVEAGFEVHSVGRKVQR